LLVPYTKRKNTNSIRQLDISRRLRANGISVVMVFGRNSLTVFGESEQKVWKHGEPAATESLG